MWAGFPRVSTYKVERRDMRPGEQPSTNQDMLVASLVSYRGHEGQEPLDSVAFITDNPRTKSSPLAKIAASCRCARKTSCRG